MKPNIDHIFRQRFKEMGFSDELIDELEEFTKTEAQRLREARRKEKMTITNGVTTMTCACGCGQSQKNGGFRAGHDEYVRSAVMYLLGRDTKELCTIFGFGPGARNAKEYVMVERKAQKEADRLAAREAAAAAKAKPAVEAALVE